MSHCKIKRFKPHNSKYWITIIDNVRDKSTAIIRLGDWADVTIRYYDEGKEQLRLDTVCYILDLCKLEISQNGFESLK